MSHLIATVGSIPLRRLAQLGGIGRDVAAEVVVDLGRRQCFGESGAGLHHVVAVEIVAPEASRPASFTHQLRVGRVERIILHFERTMAVTAVAGFHGDTGTGMFAMAAFALLRREDLADFDEARLVEAKDRMPIEWSLVTRQAILIEHLPHPEVGRTLAQPGQVSDVGLQLLADRARRAAVTAIATDRFMAGVHHTGRAEVLLVR
ncbi:MAG TPA: hypothetical protein VK540_33290 [Polyangiaceae bacterium]|nr:hypothetical protein [Polyangiaceae bacterium]